MDNKSLDIGVYEHFRYHYNKKLAGIITDKQLLLYTPYNDLKITHEELLCSLDEVIYNKEHQSFYELGKDIVILGDYKYVWIELPKDNVVSSTQLELLNYFLSKIERFNYDVNEDFRVVVEIFSNKLSLSADDITKIYETFGNLNIRDEILVDENIRGITKDNNKTYIR